MKKRLSATLIIMLLLRLIAVAAFAVTGAPDLSNPLSLTVELKHSGKAIANAPVTIYQVAVMSATGGTFTYALADDFTASEADIENIPNANANLSLASSLTEFIKKQSPAPTGATVSTKTSGLAEFSLASPGLYLVVPGEIKGYYNIAPYLVSVPDINDVSGEWIYSITAQPKTDIEAVPSPSPSPVPSPSPSPSPTPTPSEPPETEEPPSPPAETEPPEDSPTPPVITPPVVTPPQETPPPTVPENTIVPGDDEFTFIELDENGTPLGTWTYDDDTGEWIYEELLPLAELPQTGMLRWPVQAMAGGGVVLLAAGFISLRGTKKGSKDNNEA